MSNVQVVRDREIPVSNEEFLEVLFGDEWPRAHVTAFEADPESIETDAERARAWAGGAASERLSRFRREENQYFTISLFHRSEDGRAVRRKAQFDACFVIVADDVHEKIPLAEISKLPPPTYKMVTSAGSEQWGWALAEACDSRDRVENLLDGLVARGLAPDGRDPGMKGVTRYVRLPGGSNTKAKRRVNGSAFRVYLSEWNPTQLVPIEALAEAFDIFLDAPRGVAGSGLAVDDPIVRAHPVWDHVVATGHGADGWVRIDCPNAEQHSSQDASGAAVRILADGSLQCQCHHGHCNGDSGSKLTGGRLLRLIDAQHYEGSGSFLDRVDDYRREVFAQGVRGFMGNSPGERSDDDGGGFDPLRYVYLAPENKFYDVATGMLLPPRGLDNEHLRILPPGRNRMTASQFVLTQGDPQLCFADGIGWNPTGASAPGRSELVYMDEGVRWVNSWAGFALSPRAGDVSLWLAHAEYLFPDERERGVVLDYLAAIVQRVGSKPGFFLVHRGAHRIGKDLFYKPLMCALGSRCARAVGIDNVIEGWGDYVNQLKFALITEVDKAQDRKIANAMKTVTAPTASGKRVLNMKGGRVSVQVDCMGGVMMSNKRACMPIERGDKRYFVVDSWMEPQDDAYYQRIDAWYNSGEAYSAVLDYLMNRDISGFNHMILPYMTPGAIEMVDLGRFDYEQDLELFIEDKYPPFHRDVVPVGELRKLCREQGMKGGNNGVQGALERMGWVKLKGQRKVDGVNQQTPWFFTNKLGRGATAAEAHELYVSSMGST